MARTPVTTSGWYGNDDGTETYFYWEAGKLLTGETRKVVPLTDQERDEFSRRDAEVR